MNAKNLVYPLLLILNIITLSAQEVPQEEKQKPDSTGTEVLRSFYFIGDTGHGKSSAALPTLQALNDHLTSKDTSALSDDFLLFLGDNFSENDSIFWKGQLPTIGDFPGQVIFVPGEQEWANGVVGLQEAADLLQKEFDAEEMLHPVPGCPFSFIDISDEVHLIVLDSQWFIQDWDEFPRVNDDCPEIKTREAMFTEIESELKKNQEKTTIIALHHPLLSNGVHGGKNGWSSYLKPSVRKVPVPVVGQVTNLLRTSGGTSIQDAGNPKYAEFIARLRTIGKKWGKVIYASGHDHSLQYLKILSGSLPEGF